MRKQWNAEQEQDDDDLSQGIIDIKEYNKRIRDREREERDYYRETGRED